MVTLSAVSLFTGGGGIDLGLEAAGFELLAAVERDVAARATLTRNRPSWPLVERHDVFDFADSVLPSELGIKRGELDLLAGGPPCQPFSKAAQWRGEGRLGTQDDRASCIDAMVRVAERLRPKLLLVENVPGFVRRASSGVSRLGERLDDVRRRTGTRYHLHATVLRAEDYGVPQLRRRSFVVGVRDDIRRAFEWPGVRAGQNHLRAGDALFGLRVDDRPVASGRWAALLPTIPPGENYMFHTPGGGGEPLFGARTRFWSFLLKLDPGRPAWTLPATPGPATGPFHWQSRPLAIEEMARLQTFPTSWMFEGSRAARVRQVGNAAPPLLVEHVGRTLARLLGATPPAQLIHAIERRVRLPSPPPLRPVPSEFLGRCGDHPVHGGTGRGPHPRATAVG
ncbi:MAG: DNA cytosine methyltransferase [Myxococcales bacterium]|nr:DNA cytosine methyltransferase [Myxococcales bacterium]